MALITIYEGRNRQIRKMCEAVGLGCPGFAGSPSAPSSWDAPARPVAGELTTAELTAIRNASQKAENQGQQERMEKRAKENPRPCRSPAPRPRRQKSF